MIGFTKLSNSHMQGATVYAAGIGPPRVKSYAKDATLNMVTLSMQSRRINSLLKNKRRGIIPFSLILVNYQK